MIKIHTPKSAYAAHGNIAGSQIHILPVVDQDRPIVPFEEWAPYEEEIASVFFTFMKGVIDNR